MISLVVPCYNEAEILERTHRAIRGAIEAVTSDYEVLYANDGSTDDTLGVLERLAQDDPHVRVLSHTPNRGAGYAHRRLYEASRGERVILLEADLAMDPREAIPTFLDKLDSYDVVVGSRYKGVRPDYPWYRRLVSDSHRLLVRLLFDLDLRDTQAGFAGFRRPVLDAVELTSDRWEVLVELYAGVHAQGFRILEVPLKFVHGTESGETNVLVEAPRQLLNTLRLWWRLRIRRGLLSPLGLIGPRSGGGAVRDTFPALMSDPEGFDFVIVGGGFFGCCLALQLRELRPGCSLVILEREADLLTRASYHNQARIHQGYHYPRSLLTAYRSRVNFSRFVADFPECVDDSFAKYYGIGRIQSRVTAAQFHTFCQRIEAPLARAPEEVQDLFDPSLVEEVFAVEEHAFDASILRSSLAQKLAAEGIPVRFRCEASAVAPSGAPPCSIAVDVTEGAEGESREPKRLQAEHVFVCTYASMNDLLGASGIEKLDFKQELTEIALVEMPPSLQHMGVTLMCGPFFSVMPFPAQRCHSLYHVRYSRHASWFDREMAAGTQEIFEGAPRRSNFPKMIKDAERYMPAMAGARFLESSWEVRTLLPSSDADDSRPILFRQDVGGIPNLVCVLGGKIDNVYDLRDALVKYL